jgi:uncharacterized protein (DUF302 family)
MPLDGLTRYQSRYDTHQTMDRLTAAVARRGMTVVARIDHTAAAVTVGITLRPTPVLIFGNPRAGTPLMQAAPSIAIDLPLKALVWQDEDGSTWLAHDDPNWLAQRHHAAREAVGRSLQAMSEALSAVAREATQGGAMAG